MTDDHNDALAQSDAGRSLERRFQSVVLAVLTAVTGWFGLTVQDSTVKIATLGERMAGLERQLSDTRELTYTARDAQKDFQLRDATMANIASRVLALETKGR